MPEFEIVPLREAQARTAAMGRSGQAVREYISYVQQVGPDQAGRLRAAGDEKIMTVRRRLAQAAQALGMDLVIKRAGDELYFWSEVSREDRPGRGRRRQRQS